MAGPYSTPSGPLKEPRKARRGKAPGLLLVFTPSGSQTRFMTGVAPATRWLGTRRSGPCWCHRQTAEALMPVRPTSEWSTTQHAWANRTAGHQSAAIALLVAGAVGYGLAWLIHGRAAHVPSPMRSRTVSGPWPRDQGHPHDGTTGWNQPRPSGDSPKPHGDALPNVVKAVTDNGERF